MLSEEILMNGKPSFKPNWVCSILHVDFKRKQNHAVVQVSGSGWCEGTDQVDRNTVAHKVTEAASSSGYLIQYQE